MLSTGEPDRALHKLDKTNLLLAFLKERIPKEPIPKEGIPGTQGFLQVAGYCLGEG